MGFIAAIDIGSNAMRIAIAKTKNNGFEVIEKERVPVRLGTDVFHLGIIQNKTFEEFSKAMQKFRKMLDKYDVKNFRAVATSAMRDAQNSAKIREQILSETQIPIEVISGEEEAQLVFEAVNYKEDIKKGHFLLLDIGGGSIELIHSHNGQVKKKQTFPLGTVRLLELVKKTSPQEMPQFLDKHITSLVEPFLKGHPPFEHCIGTGGNIDLFIKLKEKIKNSKNPMISIQNLIEFKDILFKIDIDERIKKFDLKPDRADVIVPALILTTTVLRNAEIANIKVPEVGVREGILSLICKNA